MDRRRFLALGPAAAVATVLQPIAAHAQAGPLRFADMHSHLGILGGRVDLREAMTRNGMLVVARKIVADLPVIRRVPGGVEMYRQLAPGELARRFDVAFRQLNADNEAQRLTEIAAHGTLERVVQAGEPAVVLAAEGGDFLEGDLKRLEAFRRRGLVHLQLVHFRISELGDISTERPVHNGLTAFGREVIAECNRLGVLVDVAHATSDGIAQALEVATKPMVYSHGSVADAAPDHTQPLLRARAVHLPLAQGIARKGGVIGIYPFSSRTLDDYAGALLDAAEKLSPAHVGIGSDTSGRPGLVPGYGEFAALEELLAKRGAKAEDIRGIMGGNYLRVLGRALA